MLLVFPAAPEHMLCLQTGRYDHADRMFNKYVIFYFEFNKLCNLVISHKSAWQLY